MANSFYDHGSFPSNGAPGSSSAMRSELELIEDAFDKMPVLSGNGKKLIAVKSDGSVLEAISTIDGGGLTSLRTSSTGGIGYGGATNTGGAVTQLTSKATGVTLNRICGFVTLNNAALGAGAKASFVITNSTVAATDGVIPWVASGGTANAYRADITAVGSGSFTVTVENITGGSLGEAPVIGFAVFKATST